MMQSPLNNLYNSLDDVQLPSDNLLVEEIQAIAAFTGFPYKNATFNSMIGQINAMDIVLIRQSIVEILRLEDLKKEAVTMRQALKVDEITLNTGYHDSLIDSLAIEVKKIARILRLPVLDNMYVSTDDVEGYIDNIGEVVMNRNRGNNYLSAKSYR